MQTCTPSYHSASEINDVSEATILLDPMIAMLHKLIFMHKEDEYARHSKEQMHSLIVVNRLGSYFLRTKAMLFPWIIGQVSGSIMKLVVVGILLVKLQSWSSLNQNNAESYVTMYSAA